MACSLSAGVEGVGKVYEMGDPELRCIICEEDFSDDIVPRNLGCGHSLCTPCIDHYIFKRREKTCPECRQPFYAKSSSDMPVNYPLLRLSRSVTTSNIYSKDCSSNVNSRPKIEKGSKLIIEDNGFGPVWKASPYDFRCSVSMPKMQSEFFGMKNYIAYTILPSFSSKHVLRRYKQFDWINEQLKTHFPLIVLPQLPEKQLVGNFEEGLIEYRTRIFQSWLNRICRHPVLSQCELFQLFITVSNEKSWQSESKKIRNETEAHRAFYSNIEMPQSPLELEQIEAKVESYAHFVDQLEKALKELRNASSTQASNYQVKHQQENTDISQAFMKLGQVFGTEVTEDAPDLPLVILQLGEAYSNISKLPSEELEREWQSIHSLIAEYQTLLEGLNKVLRVTRTTITKASQLEVDDVSDAKVASYIFQAEVAHIYQELGKDIKMATTSLLSKQLKFYQMILEQLKGGLVSISSIGKEEPSAPPLELLS